ncbi:MAG: aminotransferase class V-fold PLP-dependent enzyme [Ilumatobacteraceae bacterium]|nr:aminotransferase class V-fold PLP-dependent enzyme [Ilumatobacteraceae bacterium]
MSLNSYFAQAETLDSANPLAAARHLFDLPNDQRYFLGNSLGPLTHAAREAVSQAVDSEWKTGLVRTWHDGDWFDLATETGNRIAHIIGAPSDSVIAGDSTSIALFKVLSAAVQKNATTTRNVLLCDINNFPTDRYVARSVADLFHLKYEECAVSEMATRFNENIAVVTASMIDFRSAEIYDVASITATAHAAGALTVWDLAHAAGIIPCDVERHHVDFAVGCGYKYMNGGPGAPAYMYVAPHLVEEVEQPIPGWFGHDAPFAFEDTYRPAQGILRFASGTTNILSMKALHGALEVFEQFPISAIRAGSIALGDFFIAGFDEHLSASGFSLGSPRNSADRGGHIALLHDRAEALTAELIGDGFIVDFRPPNVIRIALSPLFLRFNDIAALIGRLHGAL